MKNILKYVDESILNLCSPKFLLNGLQMHICQLVGVTNLGAFGHTLNGYEVPFRNFKYMYNNSNYKWIHPRKFDEETTLNMIAKCWEPQNDWKI